MDGEAEGKNYRVQVGQRIELELPDPADGEGPGPEPAIPLAVVHADDDVVVVDKPAGLCVHPSPGHLTGTLVNALLARFPAMAGVASRKRPGVVHRLDMDTSGLLVAALSPRAYKVLTAALQDRLVEREYLAIVHGIPEPPRGTITLPLGRDPEHRRKFAVIPPSSGLSSKPALTHYDVVERFPAGALPEAALVRLKLETGRTHQIRVHMRRLGHPIAGDALYAPERAGQLPIGRQALHAARLAFRHPVTGALLAFESPLPPDISELLERLRRS